MVFSVVAGWALAAASYRVGAFWIAVGALCDFVDGPVARAQGRASETGAFLDSTFDRVSDLAIYLGLVIGFSRAGETGSVALAGAALGTALLTSYIKARAECIVPALEGGAFERGERIAVLGLGAFSGLLVPALWVLVLAGSITVGARFRAGYRQIRARGA